MQFSQSRPGSTVRTRGAHWRVVDVRAFDACRLVTLAGLAPPHLGLERQLIEPFDTIETVSASGAPRVVRAGRWRDAFRSLVADSTPPGGLREARRAQLELLPHQLEPALAVIAGRSARILLADDVGLGKTIQAGLILAELRARGWIDRLLVITPAGLRDQWQDELSTRFAIDVAVVDTAALRRRAAALPLGLNPWSTVPAAIASIDFIKRTEILPSAAACRWDAIVVDEAHTVAGDSDRRAAVEALASRASYVLLLTATPHSGDPAAFASLCGLGSAGDRLIAFRRRRADVRGEHPRRIRTLHVRPSIAERRMHTALDAYSAAVRAERANGTGACLALSVLYKRAFSGAWALSQSVARRLRMLDTNDAVDVRQLALPLDDPTGELTSADQPPEWPGELTLNDAARERRLLEALDDACRAAARDDRKAAAVRRLLRRCGESAIVFTEYRDTLLHLRASLGSPAIVVLHGGMTREERTAAIATFERTPGAALLATDAAGEGLNLQRTCRLVVNVELPWNPMRLEQRIGRVDRFGQLRTVHACHLLARGTNEALVLDRLRTRIARAGIAIDAPDPLGAMARLGVTGEWRDESALNAGPAAQFDVIRNFGAAAAAEVERAVRARVLSKAGRCGSDAPQSNDRPLIVRTSQTALRGLIGSRALFVWRVAFEGGAGAESQLVSIAVDGVGRTRTPQEMRAMATDVATRLLDGIAARASSWRVAAAESAAAVASTRLARERTILATLETAAQPSQFQPGLFDARAARAHERGQQFAAAIRRHVLERIAEVERAADLRLRPPALVLAALP
jgi:superfamily II DNA or RNA helicase